jgi:hypothetical protein
MLIFSPQQPLLFEVLVQGHQPKELGMPFKCMSEHDRSFHLHDVDL